MIVSHDYKFIFLKTQKTAGTSIEIALSRFCGADDIITPITPNDEKVRTELGYRAPQHYLSPLRDYNHRDITRFLLKGKRKKRFYNHIPAREVRALVGTQCWDSYFKFCFERNPWDRVISLYYWLHKSEPRPTILEFVESEASLILKHLNKDVYMINGQVAVDRICRFENLSEELETVRTQLGIPERLELPHAKARYRKDKRNYRDILGEQEQKKIAALFRDEIDLFGYEF
jgi:hypothetical protein